MHYYRTVISHPDKTKVVVGYQGPEPEEHREISFEYTTARDAQGQHDAVVDLAIDFFNRLGQFPDDRAWEVWCTIPAARERVVRALRSYEEFRRAQKVN